MTALEAVNLMLLSIGKSPVNTLTVAGVNDVSFAQSILFNVTREIQHRGWWWNRERHYPVVGTIVSGALTFQRPDSVIDWTPSDRGRPLVERYNSATSTLCMYDLHHHTFDLSKYLEQDGNIHFDVIWNFPFENIPQAARSAICRRAGREFQVGAVGSQIIYQFSKEMELDAMAELERSETLNSHTNMFATPTSTNRAINRQGGFRRTWGALPL